MRRYLTNLVFMWLICFICVARPSFSNSVAEYEARRQEYLFSTVSGSYGTNLIIQAYLGLKLNQDTLDQSLKKITAKDTADFEISNLIRVLFYTDDSTDKILKTLEQQPFWLVRGETEHQYWSENHMTLWMSSAWLLHEKFGWQLSDRTLHERLIHLLSIKIKYGFYEFFSPNYFPYLLSGLLNLADFSQDETIKTLAGEAAQRLIKENFLRIRLPHNAI